MTKIIIMRDTAQASVEALNAKKVKNAQLLNDLINNFNEGIIKQFYDVVYSIIKQPNKNK